MTPGDLSELEAARRALERGVAPIEARADAPAGVLYRAVWAWSRGHRAEAHEVLLAARRDAGPYRALTVALQRYMCDRSARAAAPTAGGVYQSQPEAFAAYIRSGGNLELYDQLADQLAELYQAHQPARLLEIGPGDGQVLLAAWRPEQGAIDLVEPATDLLAAASAALTDAGIEHQDHPADIETFLAHHAVSRRWPLAQATFSLQSLPPTKRQRVLAALAERCDHLVIAEFDVPTRDDPFNPAWFLRCITRLERGLREYDDDHELVAQGFLIPTMLGFFDPTAPSNHEQPITAWVHDLHSAGYTLAEAPALLWDYWWAPAYLLHATPTSPGTTDSLAIGNVC